MYDILCMYVCMYLNLFYILRIPRTNVGRALPTYAYGVHTAGAYFPSMNHMFILVTYYYGVRQSICNTDVQVATQGSYVSHLTGVERPRGLKACVPTSGRQGR